MPHKNKDEGRKWRRKWWASLPKSRKRKMQNKANERAKKIKVFLADYKIKKGCLDCGYKKHHSALEFDHVRGKKKINLAFAKSIAQAKKEIKKCDVVCSNCHRIRSWKRLYPCKPDIFEATYEKVEQPTEH